ncbi:MAG: thiolase family protein [Burkholderiaceae bacterium]|jgi:acetyl-CoA C-acetyltransferase|nr:thiolase family protein [Burkholderiaceae bacterium]
MSARRVYIAGSAMTPFGRRRDHSTPRDWVRQVAAAALDNAGMDASQVDSVVFSSETDFLSLQLVPAPLLLDELGLVPRPVVRVESGGASGGQGVREGFMQIRAGLSKTVLVIGYEYAASHLSGDDVRMLYGLSFDAEIEGFAGATATALYALSIQAYMASAGVTEVQLASVSVKNHGNAMQNPNAHKPMRISLDDVLSSSPVYNPYKLLDCSLISDGAACVVLTSERAQLREDRPAIHIAGTGCATDHVRLGDRSDIGVFAGKQASARQAYAMAGIRAPARQIAVAELYDAYTGAELQSIEALGLCPPGHAGPAALTGEFSLNGRLPVNVSGGLIGQGGPPGATGIAQVATIAAMLGGAYIPALQPSNLGSFGVADCHAGVGTLNVTHVLERLDD